MKVLAVLMMFLAGPVAAQGVWQSYGTESAGIKQGATVCPYNDPQTGHFFCFGLFCSIGAPVEFSLITVGTDLPEQISALIEVDGSLAGTLEFQRTQNRTVFEYKAPFHPEWHPALVARLKSGRSAAVDIVGWNNQKSRQTIGLRGSSRALDAVMAVCPMPVPPPVTDPAADALAEITELCTTLGGTVSVNAGFESRQDVDLDGRPDLILNYGEAVCSQAASLYCGTAGCTSAIWLAQPDGSYQELFSGNAQGLEVLQLPVLRLNLHGSACGLIGAAPCTKDYTISNGKLHPLK